jgi:hypothetical protein
MTIRVWMYVYIGKATGLKNLLDDKQLILPEYSWILSLSRDFDKVSSNSFPIFASENVTT